MATIERHSDEYRPDEKPRVSCPPPREPATPWISTDLCLPVGEVLVLTEGRYAVAVLLRGGDDPDDRGVFMDARSCDFLPWPSYWMPLPEAERLPPSASALPFRSRDPRNIAAPD